MNNDDKCVMCGQYVPEGRQVCPVCEKGSESNKMAKFSVMLDRISDITKFVQLATKYKNEVIVSSGYFRVSGKSLLGLYSLDLTKPVTVEIFGDVPYGLQESMKEFTIQRGV